jgi:nucleoid-associated protein YgaU
VGGGGDRRGLADQALEWVLDGARHVGLELDSSERSPIFKLNPNSREYLADSETPSKAMNLAAAADRSPGPARLSEVSMSARRRWKEKAADLMNRTPYRPGTLNGVANFLNTLSDEDVGLNMPEITAGEFKLYEVKLRDNLSKISEAHFGTVKHANAIYRLNRDKLESIHRIYPGQLLRIPIKPPQP